MVSVRSQGHKNSLIESQNYYQTTIKPDIIKNKSKKDDKGQIVYELQPDFYVTEKQLDHYLYLAGNVPTRIMYTYLDEQDISSPDVQP